MSLFKGAGVAIVTPMNEDGTVNYTELKNLLEFQIKNHTDAIVICGTTGEASTLTDEEQIECVRFTVETVAKRIPVIAGAGSNHTEHAITLAQGCEKAGADAVLLVTPYYNKATQKGLVLHYTAIANSIQIPVLLYNVPSRTGVTISPQACYELSKVKNIIGIKEASGNFSNIVEIASLCGPDFELYSGNDDQVVPILSLGGQGVISVLSNIIPQDIHDMVAKYHSGDVKGAAEIQCKTVELNKAIFSEVNPIPVKKALNLMGFQAGPCKLPLCEMEDKNVALLTQAMKNYGLLK